MKPPCLLRIGVFCLLALTACEKTGRIENDGVSSHQLQNRDSVSRDQIPEIPQENQHLAKNIRDIQKLLGKEMIQTEADWAKLRASFWPASWEATVTTDGSKSARDLIKGHKYESLLRKVAKRDLADLPTDEADCLSIWYTSSLISAYSPANSLPNAFVVRGESAVTTNGDLILYVLFKDAYTNRGRRSNLDPKQKEQWRKLAAAANPVTRLLAAETYLHVEDDLSDWIGFYSAFNQDSDPYVIEKALSALYTSGRRDAIDALEKFHKNDVVRTTPRLKQMLASRIASLQKYAAEEP